ncbi:MAG TPA: DUF4294 domain-containing protein [Saprospiraceae bacterium]|nr:DUF4294 domain-containing protein [Saprospiraceae bacterium]HRK80511.1 DUF4294 domain-containing protein [Saprospiraceae bacterium]
MIRSLFIITFLLFVGYTYAQPTGKVTLNGKPYPFIIDDCGDTLIVANLEDISVSSPRMFDNEDEAKKYRRYRRYAADVYPYAVEAIKVFHEVQDATEDMRRGKAKRYAKHLYKDMKDNFEDPLKNLTKTQGMILIKMVERELKTPTYFIIKDLRGNWTAGYWGTVGKMFGHNLKEGYIPGKDRILDMVLDDFNVSYKMPSK